MQVAGPNQKRKRTWMPKVKTGCRTCKLRKIKCDEAKPVCLRCSTTRRRCDGYEEAKPRRGVHHHTNAFSSSASHGDYPPLTLDPGFFVPQSSAIGLVKGTSREQRSFHYFRTTLSCQLAGFFDTTLWGKEMLLAAVHEPAIRHLVVALGATHEQFSNKRLGPGFSQYARLHESGTYPSSSSAAPHWQPRPNTNVEFRLPDAARPDDVQFVLQQCNRAIQHLVTPSATETLEQRKAKVLAASILFTCIAQLRGMHLEAIKHLRGGLTVLYEVEEAEAKAKAAAARSTSLHSGSSIGSDGDSPSNRKVPKQTSPEDQTVSVDRLRQLFTSLNIQARSQMTQEALLDWPYDPKVLSEESYDRTGFSTLSEARDYVEALYNQVVCFLQQSEMPDHLRPSYADMERQHASLKRSLDFSMTALDALLVRQQQQQPQHRQPQRRSGSGSAPPSGRDNNPTPLNNNNTNTKNPPASNISTARSSPPPPTGFPQWTCLPITPPPSITNPPFHSPSPVPIRDQLALSLITLYQTVLTVWLHIDPRQPWARESTFDALHPEMQRIVDICANILHRAPGNGRPSYNPGFGVVMPLHLVAVRCRDPVLRRRAVDLLLEKPRREGLWDGLMAAKVALQRIELEERLAAGWWMRGGSDDGIVDHVSGNGSGDDGFAGIVSGSGSGDEGNPSPRRITCAADVPEDVRIRELEVKVVGEHRAQLYFVTVGHWKRGEKGYTIEITF